MRRAALSILLASVLTLPALADGAITSKRRAYNGLPQPQPGVVVSMERGVRVWRPVTATSLALGAASAYPQATVAESYTPAYIRRGGYGYGLGLPYGGGYVDNYGYGNGRNRDHETAYGSAFGQFDNRHGHVRHDDDRGFERGYDHRHGVTIYRPQQPRYAMAPVTPYTAAPMYGSARPPVHVHVNIGPLPQGAPRRDGTIGRGVGHGPGPANSAPAHVSGGRGHR